MRKLKHKLLMGMLAVSSLIKSQTLPCQGVFTPTGSSTSNVICSPTSNTWLNKYRLQQSYVPGSNTAMITVKITLHLFTDDNGSSPIWENNNNSYNGLQVLNANLAQITNNAADRYSVPRSATYSSGAFSPPLVYINDSRIRYEVTNIYFYANTFLHTNTNPSNHFNFINTNYPGRLDEGLPILMGNTGWQFQSGTNGAPAVCTSIGAGWGPAFFKTGLLHEIAHCFGLYHTYYASCCPDDLSCTNIDYLSDVFPSGQTICPVTTGTIATPSPPTNPCQSCYELNDNNFNQTSNNVMAGGASDWISPLQMGRRIRNMRLPGNGMRKFAKDVPSDHILTWNITNDETWDFDIQMYEDIIVKSGSTLRVKCKIAMAKEGRIIVENGASLIVDGGEITTWSKTGMWAGIFVSGTSNQFQSATDDGILRVLNNGTLSNADVAINTFTIDATSNIDWNSTGGIIGCTNANFINNRKDVQYMYYHQTGGGNAGYFTNCNFKVNAPLLGGAILDSRISLYEVDGVKINGCNFENTSGSLPSLSGNGINSIDASYTIDKNGTINTKFTGFTDGVHVDNTNPLRVVSLKNTNFYDNFYNSTYYNNITTPIFENNYVRTASDGNGTGLYLNNCKNYTVKNNTFIQNTTLINGGDIGINVNNSQAGAHKIYRNSFANFAVGIGALNDNSGISNSVDGLQMNCNDFTPIQNGYDIALMGVAPTVNQTQGVIGAGANVNNVVRNKYAAIAGCGSCENQWYVQGTSSKIYLHGSNSNTYTKPLPQPNLSDVGVIVAPITFTLDYAVHCPATTTPTIPSCPCGGCCRLAEINSGLNAAILQNNSTMADFNSILDGGNTQNLLDAIYGNTSNGNLKDMLENKQYLSDTVLKAYISKISVPGGNIKDVFEKNVPVSPKVWQAILGRNFSNGIMADLNEQQASKKISKRSSAEVLVSLSKFNLQDMATQKLNYFLTDSLASSKDSVVKILQTNVGQLSDAKMLLVYAHLNNRNFDAAMKANLDLRGTQPDLADYIDKLINLQTDPKKAFGLLNRPSDIEFLKKYASNTNNVGYGGAQALLKFVNGINYTVPRLYPIQNGNNGARLLNNELQNDSKLTDMQSTDFMVYPNPTNNILNFMYKGNTDCTSINLVSTLGTIVYSSEVKINTISEINLSNFDAGVYFLTAFNGKEKIYQTKVIYIK